MRNDRWATDSEIKAALRCFLGDKGTGGPYCTTTTASAMYTTGRAT